MEKYKFYLQDLVELLKDKLEQSKERELSSPENIYYKGIVMGLYETIDLIKQQANAFNIPLDEIGLDNYFVEKFL